MGAEWERYLRLAASVVALFDAGVAGGALGVAGGALGVAGEATDLRPAPGKPLERFVGAAARQIAENAKAELARLGQADAGAAEDRVARLVAAGDRVGLLAAAVLGHSEFERTLLGDGAVAFAALGEDAQGYVRLLVAQLHGAVLRFAQDPEVFPLASTRALRDLAVAVAERPTWAQVRHLVEAELDRRPKQLIDGDRPHLAAWFSARGELAAVEAALDAGGRASVTALEGMRGVGKSQLAAAYAQACEHARWPAVVWVSAQSRDQAVTQLADIARRAHLADDDATAEEAARLLVAWLSGLGGDRLVVFDNVEAVEDLDGLLPRGPGMRVLVTTTLRTYALGTPVEVGVFTPEQAARYLVDSTGLEDADGAARVAADLGRLPVALAQAAAAIVARGYDFTAYRRVLADHPLDEAVRLADGGYPDLVGVALWVGYQTVLERLSNRSVPLAQAARAVLGALTLLAESGVEREWLYSATNDDGLCREAVGELIRGSVANQSASGATISLHRLQAIVVRDDLNTDDADTAQEAAVAVLSAAAQGEERLGLHAGRARSRALAAQMFAIRNQDQSAELLEDLSILALSVSLMHRLRALGDPRAAIALSDWVTDIQRIVGADEPATLTCRSILARAYQEAGDLSRAIPLHEKTLADRERVLGADHPDTQTSRTYLALALESVGDLGRAIPLFEAVVAERERALEADHPTALTSRNNLAFAYARAGDLGRAIPLFEAVVADMERSLGADHPSALTARNNLALAYSSAGDFGRAISLYEAVAADTNRVLGEDHPHALGSRSNLALAYASAGDLDRAIPLYEAIATDTERALGADHPHALTFRNNLAAAYEAAGDLGRAILLYRATLAACERVLSPGHPTTELVRENLARASSY